MHPTDPCTLYKGGARSLISPAIGDVSCWAGQMENGRWWTFGTWKHAKDDFALLSSNLSVIDEPQSRCSVEFIN